MKKILVTLGIMTLVITVIDQWTKNMILDAFTYGESIHVIKNYFNITYVRNYGAAFGFLKDIDASIRDTFFLIMPPCAMIVILFMLKATQESEWTRRLALCGVFAGALGNYIDRVRFGYVVDFLDFHYFDFYSYPAFNVADISIVCGVTVLIILEIFTPQQTKEKST